MAGAHLRNGLAVELGFGVGGGPGGQFALEGPVEPFVGVEFRAVAGEMVNGDFPGVLAPPGFDRGTGRHAQVVQNQAPFAPAGLPDQAAEEAHETRGVERPFVNHPPPTALVGDRAHHAARAAARAPDHVWRPALRSLAAHRVGLIMATGLISPINLRALGFSLFHNGRILLPQPPAQLPPAAAPAHSGRAFAR